jgi:RNA polymerase sigma-70 factor (ECF subfamily)
MLHGIHQMTNGPHDMREQGHPKEVSGGHSLCERSDPELVEMLVEGNHDAMSVIFDRYYRLVMSVALRIVRDSGEAQDVVQVVFTDFYRQANLFDASKGSLKSWLLQYSYGRSINRKKSLKAQNFYDKADIETVDPASLSRTKKLFDLDSGEAAMLIEQVLATLSDDQRKVIELVCFYGMTTVEVAHITGESFGNVQHTYYRGIEKLRVYLRECDERARDARAPSGDLSVFCRVRHTARNIHGSEVKIVKARAL